jgi:bifunctional non-homologous end joining protein LigD
MNAKILKKVSGARKASMPEFVSPELATLTDKPPEGMGWLHELKFDGYRMLCHLSRKQVKFWSRNGKDWSHKFPTVAKVIKELPVSSAILDGEIVAVDSQGHASFQKLQQTIGKPGSAFTFHIFDLLYLDGFILTGVKLRERKELLAQLLATADEKSPLRYSDHVEGNGLQFFKQACAYKIEGVVSKHADSLYESTRSKSWLKIKCIMRQEFIIAGYLPSEKGFPGFGALLLGVYENGTLTYAGRVGTGFSIKQRLALKEKLDHFVKASSPFAALPKDSALRKAVWTTPKLVGEVAFTEWTSDGFIRHPSFQGLRLDKKPSEVVREKPA